MLAAAVDVVGESGFGLHMNRLESNEHQLNCRETKLSFQRCNCVMLSGSDWINAITEHGPCNVAMELFQIQFGSNEQGI